MQEFRVFRALGLAFKSWFRNFIPFTILTAILYSPVVIWLSTLHPEAARTPEEFVNAAFVRPLYVLAGLAALLPPLLTYRVVQDLNGQRVSIFTSMKYGVRGIVPAVMLGIITNILGMIPFGSIVGAVLICIWFVVAPAAVAERLGPFAAFSRSAELTSGRRWGIFGLTFLVGLVLAGLLLFMIMPLFNGAHEDTLSETWKATAIKSVITMGVFHMFTGIVQAISYALLRQDKDGVSHDDLARVFD